MLERKSKVMLSYVFVALGDPCHMGREFLFSESYLTRTRIFYVYIMKLWKLIDVE